MADTRRLTAARVRTAPPGKHGDGRGGFGLRLVVSKAGTRSWVQRLVVNGRVREIGLGGYPLVTLAAARRMALENARAAKAGGDPLADKRRPAAPTFEEAARAAYALRRPDWRSDRHAAQWIGTLERYAFPRIGALPVSDVTTADVMRVLVPIWNERRETARRVRQRVGAVMRWAVANGHRTDNPAGDAIAEALPRNGNGNGGPRHHRAIPHGEVAAAVRAVRASGASASTRLAFEFLVLTAARSGEVRAATFAEIDLDAGVWTIPASRTKANRDHRVPLCARARRIVAEARSATGGAGTGLLFPGVRRGVPISDGTFVKLLRDLGVDSTAHGFRSSFRDWCGELSGQPREVAEAALAHEVGNRTEAAYARSDLFDRRRSLMDDWARYLDDAMEMPAPATS